MTMDCRMPRCWLAEDDFDLPESSLYWKQQHSASSGSTGEPGEQALSQSESQVSTLLDEYSRQSTETAVRMMGDASRADVEAVLRDVVSNSPGCVTVAEPSAYDEGPEGTLVAVSQEFEALTGYNSEEMVGKSGRFLNCGPGHESDPYSTLHMRLACQTGQPFTALRTNRRKTGELFLDMFHIRGLSVAADENSPEQLLFLLGVHTDATEACAEDEESAQQLLEDEANKVFAQIQMRLSPLLRVVE